MLFLETRNGAEFATLRVMLPSSQTSRTPDKNFLGSTAKEKDAMNSQERQGETGQVCKEEVSPGILGITQNQPPGRENPIEGN